MVYRKILIIFFSAALVLTGCTRRPPHVKPQEKADGFEKESSASISADNDTSGTSGTSSTSGNGSGITVKNPVLNSDAVSTDGEENFDGDGDRLKKVNPEYSEKKELEITPNIINTEENVIHNYFLLSEQTRGEDITPEDFQIGELYTGEKTFKPAVDLISAFFKSLKEKKVEKELIETESRFYIGKIFDEYVKGDYIPEIVRIGKPVFDNGIITANLRFIKNTGKTEGEIIIIKKEDKLFIRGFKGDLSLLELKDGSEEEKFEPEIYKFH